MDRFDECVARRCFFFGFHVNCCSRLVELLSNDAVKKKCFGILHVLDSIAFVISRILASFMISGSWRGIDRSKHQSVRTPPPSSHAGLALASSQALRQKVLRHVSVPSCLVNTTFNPEDDSPHLEHQEITRTKQPPQAELTWLRWQTRSTEWQRKVLMRYPWTWREQLFTRRALIGEVWGWSWEPLYSYLAPFRPQRPLLSWMSIQHPPVLSHCCVFMSFPSPKGGQLQILQHSSRLVGCWLA